MKRGSLLLVIGILLFALAPHAEAKKASDVAAEIAERDAAGSTTERLRDDEEKQRERAVLPERPRIRRETPEELANPPADATTATRPSIETTPAAADAAAMPTNTPPTGAPVAPAPQAARAAIEPAARSAPAALVPPATQQTSSATEPAPPALREPLTHTALLDLMKGHNAGGAPIGLPTRSTLELPANDVPTSSGAAIARPPAALSPTSAAEDAGGIARLLWGIPILGLMGVGTVLMLRRPAQEQPAPPAPKERITLFAAMPTPDLPALLQHAQSAAARGAHAEATTYFDRALAKAPGLTVAIFCKGVCLAALGRHEDALSAFRAALEAEPDNAEYRIHFARSALSLSRQPEALSALGPIARDMPDVAPAMLEDPQLAPLRDHPMFLAMCGAL